MNFATAIYGAIYGCIVSIIWSLALQIDLKTGLVYGSIIGAIIGFLMGQIQKGVSSRGTINQTEAGFVSGSFLAILLMLGVVTGLITWGIRAIFF